MRSRLSVLFSFMLIVAASAILRVNFPLRLAPPTSGLAQLRTVPAPQARIIAAYGRLPLSFEANRGQSAEAVKFLSRGAGYDLFLTSTEAVLSLKKPEVRKSPQIAPISPIVFQSAPSAESADAVSVPAVLRMKLLGSNPAAQIFGADKLPGKTNYFMGNDPTKWRTSVPTYAKVKYADVYPGIDLVYYGNQQQLEYDFIVSPGADPAAIRLAFSGLGSHAERFSRRGHVPSSAHPSAPSAKSADEVFALGSHAERCHPERREGSALFFSSPCGRVPASENSSAKSASSADFPFASSLSSPSSPPIRIDAHGDLVLDADGTELRLRKPLVYQEVNGARREVPGNYVLESRNDTALVSFHLAAYDKTKPLIVDPVLVYSTYLGGSGTDTGSAIAVDSSGNAYVTGQTTSTNFPTANAFQGASGGGNCGPASSPSSCPHAFVTKLNAAGSALVYSTYLGGNGSDYGSGIAVDTSGNAFVTGVTNSTNFPTMNAFQPLFGGGVGDAFVTKLNAAGSALVYSTYLGGSDSDQGNGIAVDSSGNAYVTGFTYSTNFHTANALQAANRGVSSAFVTKLNAAGSALVYSTYLGGSDSDQGNGIAVDSSGNAYVTGSTTSTNFPTTANAFQVNYGGTPCIQEALPPPCGPWDAFVTKLNATGSALVYSTYLGVGFNDFGLGIAVDSSGNAYVTGSNATVQRPAHCLDPGCFYEYSLVSHAFVTKLNAAGSAQVYFTYLGGDYSNGSAIAVDSPGNAYVAGSTTSINYPTANAFQATIGSAFATEVIAAGSALVYYIGGSGPAVGLGVAVDSSGNAYVTGSTSSNSFPTMNAFQAALGGTGAQNAFVTKFSAITLPLPVLSTTSLGFSSYVTGPNPPNQSVTISSLANIGSGTMPWTATVTSGSWLSVSPATGTGNGTLTVSVNISGLPSGTYSGTIQVAATNTPNSQETLTVTLNLAPPPSISPSPSSLSFTAYQGEPNPSSLILKINNPGGGTLQWTASVSSITGGNWLTISPASGNQTQALTVSVNISGLTPQNYTATILVAAPNISSSAIPVTLLITPAPSIAVSPSNLMFVGQVGGAVSPSQTVSVSSTLNWTATITSGAWLAISPTSEANNGTLTVSVNISGLAVGTYNGTIQVAATGSNTPATISVTLAVITPGTPVIGQNAIVNGASFAAGAPLTAGAIASVFGTNFSTSTASATSLPLPTTLGGVSVQINGISAGARLQTAPLFAVSPQQINFQIPWELLGQPQATIVVTANGVASSPATINLGTYSPGLFATNQQGTGQGAILLGGTPILAAPVGTTSTSLPARRGQFVTIFCTGLGAVTNPPATGAAAPTIPPSLTTTQPTVTVGGSPATVSFSGLAPGFVGLYQVNIQIPQDAPTGDAVPLALTIGDITSNTVTLAVQ